MKSNRFLFLAASISLAMIFTFSCSGDGSVIDSIVAADNTDSEVWDGTVNTDWYNASQTEYIITTAQQLAGLAKLVNEGNGFAGKTVKLGTSINLGGIAWTPIGDIELGFAGIFDGGGYEISGVYVNNRDGEDQGLFGGIEVTGEIRKLGVIDSDVRGYSYVGGLTGYNNGTIRDSYFIGNVSGDEEVGGLIGQNYLGTVSNSYSAAIVDGKLYVGGLVGRHGLGNINNSYSSGVVMGRDESGYSGKTGEFIGGFVGNNDDDGIIMNCYSTGTVTGEKIVGGFVAANEGEISNSYSMNKVSGNQDIGGFAGANDGGTINSSYYNMETSGQNESVGGEGKTTAELKEQATYVGWNFSSVWGIDPTKNSGYPYLKEIVP